MTKKNFSRHLIATFATYRSELSDIELELWIADIETSGIDWEQAVSALGLYRRTAGNKFAPRISDIVEVCHGTADDAAETAWGRVQDAVRRVGKYTSVVFDDIKTMNAIELSGGWVKMCNADLANEMADRAAFRKAYHAAKSDTCRNMLPGLHVDDSDEIRMLGEPEKCYQIMQQGTEKSTIHGIGTNTRELISGITEDLKINIKGVDNG